MIAAPVLIAANEVTRSLPTDRTSVLLDLSIEVLRTVSLGPRLPSIASSPTQIAQARPLPNSELIGAGAAVLGAPADAAGP